jgi:hypothetical protein
MGWMCVCGCVGERTEAERRSGDSNRVSGYMHESVKSLPRIDADQGFVYRLEYHSYQPVTEILSPLQ